MDPDLVDKLNAFSRQGKGGTQRLNLSYADGWSCVLCGLGGARCLGPSCLGKVPPDPGDPLVMDADHHHHVERTSNVVISSLCDVISTGKKVKAKRVKR